MMLQRTRISVLVAAACAMMASGSVTAATDPEINRAIAKGIDYLVGAQQVGGSWDYGSYDPAATGAAVYALLTQRAQWATAMDPSTPYVRTYSAAQIQTAVDNGIAYLLANATTATVSTKNGGANICPGGSGTCTGIYWNAANNEDSYTTGLIAPAIALYGADKGAGTVATTTGPLAGMTWGAIAQDINNLWGASQAGAPAGNRNGGWRYVLGNPQTDADMSTTQWGIVSMIYDQTLGASIPGVVTTDLAKWLAAVQNASGAGCYQPGSSLCDHSDTGGMLLGLDLIGKPVSDPAVQKAIGFLNTNWQAGASGTWYGNFGHPYAMWSAYKGLEATLGLADTTSITNLRPGNCGGDRGTDCNWWQDYNEYLVSSQASDGRWVGYSEWTGNLATAFYLPILGGTQIPGPEPSAPEPATLALIGLGLAGFVMARRRNPS